jgi:hypothetical protein
MTSFVSLTVTFLGNRGGDGPRVLRKNVGLAERDLKVVEADDSVFFCVLALGLVGVVVEGIDDVLCTLVTLAEVGECQLPALRFHGSA